MYIDTRDVTEKKNANMIHTYLITRHVIWFFNFIDTIEKTLTKKIKSIKK